MIEIQEIIKGLTNEHKIEILLAIIVVIVFRMISSTVAKTIIRIFRPRVKEKTNPKANPFYAPLKTITTFIGIYIALTMLKNTLEMSVEGVAIISKIIKISLILFIAKAFGEWLENRDKIVKKMKEKSDKEIDEATTKLLLRTIKIIIYVIAGFMVISELGYDISGFITGLGIGGIVVTLAAQDTAKSIIGGIAILIDKPYKVGDFIKVGEHEGTVEDMKFRSTSIRTLDDTVLHIPNSEMSVLAIINYSEINTRRYFTKLKIEINTETKEINKLEKKLRDMLRMCEYVVQGTEHVNFTQISSNGIEITISAYVHEKAYYEFLDIKEIINYKIAEILKQENISIAYTTQTIQVKNES